MKKAGFIYRITCLVNGKIYIGKTKRSVRVRYTEHWKEVRENDQTPLHNAMRKYGRDAFEIKQICSCDNEEQIKRAEIFFIAKFCSRDRKIGYNVDDGSNQGAKVSEAGKARISAANKGRVSAMKGKTMSAESRELMRQAKLGKCFHSPEYLQRLRERMQKGEIGLETRYKIQ